MSEKSSLRTRPFGWKTTLQESQLADFRKWSIVSAFVLMNTGEFISQSGSRDCEQTFGYR